MLSFFKKFLIPKIGITENQDPICPSCKTILEKRPKAKTKCRSCGEFIYVVTRLPDKKKVLVSEQEREEIRKQWDENNNGAPRDKAVLEADKKKSAKEWRWADYNRCNRELIELNSTNKGKDGYLQLIFESVYLELNGPVNMNAKSEGDRKELMELGQLPFDLKEDITKELPHLLNADLIKEELTKLGYNKEKAKEVFIETASSINLGVKFPRSPIAAWDTLSKHLF